MVHRRRQGAGKPAPSRQVWGLILFGSSVDHHGRLATLLAFDAKKVGSQCGVDATSVWLAVVCGSS